MQLFGAVSLAVMQLVCSVMAAPVGDEPQLLNWEQVKGTDHWNHKCHAWVEMDKIENTYRVALDCRDMPNTRQGVVYVVLAGKTRWQGTGIAVPGRSLIPGYSAVYAGQPSIYDIGWADMPKNIPTKEDISQLNP